MTPSGPFHLPVARGDSVHGAHLCASVAIVSERGLARAETEMPDIIRSYNLACGVTNSDTEGYHQTLTLFYLRETARYLDLFSVTSRRIWQPPDIRALTKRLS